MTRKVDYALLILAFLRSRGTSSARNLAKIFNLPPSLTANVLKEMCAAGLLESTRGKCGGYRLGRPAADITLKEIFEALGGRLAISYCLKENNSCRITRMCPSHTILAQVNEEISAVLEKYTVADLIETEAVAIEKSAAGRAVNN